jgi:hypothetical protein
MNLIRTVLSSRQGKLVLAALSLYLLWKLGLALAAPAKVSPEIDRDSRRVNVLVTLPFTPERFHVLMFQRYGRVSGTLDQSVEVRNVDPSQLNTIARYYWVSRVDPLPTDQ